MALQADPVALRMGAQHFSAASNAMEASLNSMYGRILALVEDGYSGWIGDGATAFLARLNAEVNHYRNGIQALRQIPPILLYLAAEMEEIIALRRQADELEAEAQNASPIEAAWLLARAAALRAEAEAKAEFADFKGAAEFLAVDVRQMATDFWDSAPIAFIRHEVTEGVTWMKHEFKNVESELKTIGEHVLTDGEQFVKGAGDSALSNVTFGSADNVPDNPTLAYGAGRLFGDSLGIADGVGTIVGGAAAMVGGGLLDTTVLLTPAGVALNVAGAAVVGYGGAESVKATHGLVDDLHSLFSRKGDDSSGGEVPPKEKTEGTSEGMGKAQVESSSPYGHIPDAPTVGPGKKFTKAQKEKIIQENMKANDGVVKSDKSGTELVKPQKSTKGVRPNPKEWQIDHVDPKSKGGSNSYGNAQVLSRTENREKSNK